MKVAVCVGGLLYPETEELMDNLQNKFPNYDFFFGVWKGRENATSDKLCAWSFEEHEPKYHPYFDVDIPDMAPKIKLIRKNLRAHPEMPMIPRAFHQTKQILMHSYMLDKLPQDYDMIIRTRYDIKSFDPSIDFECFVEESYNSDVAIGFAKTWFTDPKVLNNKTTPYHRLWEGYLMDIFLLHPRKLFKRELMMSLHEQQKLLAAEFGWYQVLSQPYGSNHRNYFCNIKIARDK